MGEEKSKKDKKTFKEEYEKLKVKYALPEYELIDKDFEIGTIDAEDNILREILKSIHDQIDAYNRILENLIQPDSKLCDMKEAGELSKEDQALIVEMYRKGMLLSRNILLLDLDYEEKETAKAITQLFSEWEEMKKDIRKILEKMRDTWKVHSEQEKYGGGYFG